MTPERRSKIWVRTASRIDRTWSQIKIGVNPSLPCVRSHPSLMKTSRNSLRLSLLTFLNAPTPGSPIGLSLWTEDLVVIPRRLSPLNGTARASCFALGRTALSLPVSLPYLRLFFNPGLQLHPFAWGRLSSDKSYVVAGACIDFHLICYNGIWFHRKNSRLIHVKSMHYKYGSEQPAHLDFPSSSWYK